MNNIKIINNKLENYSNDYIIVKNNNITFLKSNEYNIEYINSTNISINFILNSNVDINLFIMSKDNNININNTYNLDENSNLILNKFYCNEEIKENITINLNGKNATFTTNFSSISKNIEQYNLIINHNNSNTKSYVSNKCIGYNESKLDFTIDSILPKGNINCIIDQTTKVLTLSDVDAKINPNMFIEEDSTEARHGSVISTFNEEEIFYLTSRGIPKEEAIYLLIKGFIFSNLDLDMNNKAIILECINSIRR